MHQSFIISYPPTIQLLLSPILRSSPYTRRILRPVDRISRTIPVITIISTRSLIITSRNIIRILIAGILTILLRTRIQEGKVHSRQEPRESTIVG